MTPKLSGIPSGGYQHAVDPGGSRDPLHAWELRWLERGTCACAYIICLYMFGCLPTCSFCNFHVQFSYLPPKQWFHLSTCTEQANEHVPYWLNRWRSLPSQGNYCGIVLSDSTLQIRPSQHCSGSLAGIIVLVLDC